MFLTWLRYRRARAIISVLALASTEACYAYMPVGSGGVATPTPGQRVRVSLTTEGTIELARYLGPSVVTVEGELASVGADGAMLIGVDYVRMSNGVSQPWNGEGMVSFPRAYVSETRGRSFQRRKTVLASSILGTLLVGTAILALRSGGAKGGVTQPPPPPP